MGGYNSLGLDFCTAQDKFMETHWEIKQVLFVLGQRTGLWGGRLCIKQLEQGYATQNCCESRSYLLVQACLPQLPSPCLFSGDSSLEEFSTGIPNSLNCPHTVPVGLEKGKGAGSWTCFMGSSTRQEPR